MLPAQGSHGLCGMPWDKPTVVQGSNHFVPHSWDKNEGKGPATTHLALLWNTQTPKGNKTHELANICFHLIMTLREEALGKCPSAQ